MLRVITLMLLMAGTSSVYAVEAVSSVEAEAEQATATSYMASVTSDESNQSADTVPATSETTEPMSSHYLMQLVIGLIIVVMCIVVLGWFAKRMNRFQSSSDGALRIIGGLSMGARERIVLLQVGEQQMLVGVAPGRVNKLHVFDEAIDIDSETRGVDGSSFAEKLATMLSGQAGATATEPNQAAQGSRVENQDKG